MKFRLIEILVVLLILAVPSCVYWVEHSPSAIQRKQDAVAKVEAERLPRKVNEANGCEVWAFKPGDRWLYFTRCGVKTETVNTWDVCRSVSQGKTTRTECKPDSMAITQEPQ